MRNLIASLKALQSGDIRSLVKELPEIVLQIDSKGNISDFFFAEHEIFQIPQDSITGQPLEEVCPPEWLEKVTMSVGECRKTKQIITFECTRVIREEPHFFEAKVIPNGETIVVFFNDVTEKKALQRKNEEHHRQLTESEQRFRLLAEHLPGAVYLCANDADFSMIYLNEKIFEITGYTPLEFISKRINFPDIYHPDDIAKIYAEVEKKLNDKKSFQLEYRIFHKSGEIRWIEEFGTGVFIEGELTHLEGYLQDITDRKNIELKILQQNEALIKTNEELDRFVYSTSHDLRSPLSSLLGLINLGMNSTSVDDFKLIFSKMKDRLSDLDHFIKEITEYSQNSRLDLELNNISLLQVVKECITALENMEEASGITFEIDIPPQLEIGTDVRRLKIVLNNLIGNAIKYADPAKSQRWVRINAMTTDDECLISIKDNGLGIPQKFHDKIFNMFYRASDRSTGSGLGLYIVKETAARMNSKIEFTSTEGVGSEFILSFSTRSMSTVTD